MDSSARTNRYAIDVIGTKENNNITVYTYVPD